MFDDVTNIFEKTTDLLQIKKNAPETGDCMNRYINLR